MFPASLPASTFPAYPQEQVLHPATASVAETDGTDRHKEQGVPSSVGRAGFERLLEQDRYRIPFNIKTPQALKTLLARFSDEFADPRQKRPCLILSGAGVVGMLVAVVLRERYGYNVLIVEKRTSAWRQNVLELKRFLMKEFPPALIELLVKEKLITRSLGRAEVFGTRKGLRRAPPRSILADLAAPQPPIQRQSTLLLPPPAGAASIPWAYPDPAIESDSDFYAPYALTQTRDMQAGLSRYCRQIGVHFLHGEITELDDRDDQGEFVPGIQLSDVPEDAKETIRPPAALAAVVLITEGNTRRIDAFGGVDAIDVDEVWQQRNYRAHHRGVGGTGGGSIEVDRDGKAAVIAQVWDGPDGLQANVSVLPSLSHAARMRAMSPAEAERELDALFARAPLLLAKLPTPIIVDQSQETWRSPPVPIHITRARNPVHGNVIFLGDSPGLSSPFNSRGANDGAAGQLRILMEYIHDPRYLSASPGLRKEAENLARQRFNDVYRVRHGAELDLMLQFGFYTEQQVAEIKASFEKDRRMP